MHYFNTVLNKILKCGNALNSVATTRACMGHRLVFSNNDITTGWFLISIEGTPKAVDVSRADRDFFVQTFFVRCGTIYVFLVVSLLQSVDCSPSVWIWFWRLTTSVPCVTLHFVIATQFVIYYKLRCIATQFVIHRISNWVATTTRFVIHYKLRQNFIIWKYWICEKKIDQLQNASLQSYDFTQTPI